MVLKSLGYLKVASNMEQIFTKNKFYYILTCISHIKKEIKLARFNYRHHVLSEASIYLSHLKHRSIRYCN